MRVMILLMLLVGCEPRAPRESQMSKQSKIDETKLKLKKYAYEAFPQWAAAHADKQCPNGLSELDEYMNTKDANDSWGRPIKMVCGPGAPANVKGLGVVSAGEDGKEGTGDDLNSWD